MEQILRTAFLLSNILALISGIIVCSVTVYRWGEYAGGAISILVSIYGLILACSYGYIRLLVYMVLVFIDLVISLANGIILVIFMAKVRRYCFDGEKSLDYDLPDVACNDWRTEYGGNGYFARATTVSVFLFIGVALKILNGVCAFFMTRFHSDGGGHEGGDQDMRMTSYPD
jgi:hypothetical protein